MYWHCLITSTIFFGFVLSLDKKLPPPQAPQLPVLNVTLTPIFENERATAIRVELGISSLSLHAQEPLLTAPVEIVTVDVGRIENDVVHASDRNGELPLVSKQDPYGPTVVSRYWTPTRAIAGDVQMWYIALPRTVNDTTKNLPSFDLREDHGGLFGSGYGFLAVPPNDAKKYDIRVRWKLTDAPSGTKAVWTFGEGPAVVTRQDVPSILQTTYFAVGPLKSSESALATRDGLSFGMYWFSKPPFDAAKVASVIEGVFLYMSKFFDDDEKSYRVFLRYNPYRGSGAGTALRRSFMFSYDDQDFTDPPSEEDQIKFLAHEMVHNWALLDDTAPEYENWFSEGLAEYYSLELLYRGGFLLGPQYLKAVNNRLTSYYTNGLVNMSNLAASKLAWKTSDAQTLPYGRGFVYAIQTNHLISTTTNGRESLDNLVLDIIHRNRQGLPAGISTYISLLSAYLGASNASVLYRNMSSGMLVIPSSNSLAAHGVSLERHDVERWDIGFDESSITSGARIVKGLKPGSRAGVAGVRNGDRIMNAVRLRELREDVESQMILVIKRQSGETVELKYRPRSIEKVESYKYIAVGKDRTHR